MLVAKISITGVRATVLKKGIITAGMVGAQVHIDYTDPIWDNLAKTVVFSGVETRDVITNDPDVTIPPECIAKPIQFFRVGVYGVDHSGGLVIPTVWANIGPVLYAADPSGDTSTDPSLPVWAQILRIIGNLDNLATEAKDSLVSAINEAASEAAKAAASAKEAKEHLLGYDRLESRLKSGKIEDAEYHLGFYLDENGDLCQKEE